MKKLRLFLLWLLTPLLFGNVFALNFSQDEVNYIVNNSINSWSFTNVNSYILYDYWSNPTTSQDLCIVFSWLTFTNVERPAYSISVTPDPSRYEYETVQWGASYPYFLYCTNLIDFRYLKILQAKTSSYKSNFNVDRFRVLPASKITNWYLGFDIDSLLSNYNQCQTDLNNCDTITSQCLVDKSTLSWQLVSCNADKVSLNNNIDSLTLQLQNCLWQSCNGSGVDIGTWLYFNQYSLYRTDDEIDYSTPITNNLFLPLWYKWKINEDNILSIAKINTLETAYQFDDTGKTTVINSMSIVMLFFLGTWLLIVVIMYLRRFISKK